MRVNAARPRTILHTDTRVYSGYIKAKLRRVEAILHWMRNRRAMDKPLNEPLNG